MQKRYIVLAGLPRSGSTVLSSILCQNPAIFASPNSPLVELLVNVDNHLNTTEQARAFLQPNQTKDVLEHILAGFYHFTDRPVIIDKSRAWPHPHNLALLESVTDTPVVCIAMVRSIPAVISSFLRKIHEHPEEESFVDKALRTAGRSRTDEARVEWFLSPGGTVYESLCSLQLGYESQWRARMHFVEYDDLVAQPTETLRQLYQAIGEPYYEHDLQAITNPNPEDDTVYGVPGLHQVRPQLQSVAPDPRTILTPELYARCQAVPHFWRQTTAPTVTPVIATRSNPLHITSKRT